MDRFGNWTPEQRAALVAMVRENAVEQIEGDPELRTMIDWMIAVAGLLPPPAAYRLAFLVSCVLIATGEA